MSKILRFIIYTFILGASFFLLSALVIIIDGLKDNIHASDAIIILGNKVELDGRPSQRLKTRLDRGLELYNESTSPFIIVTGGLGKEGFDEAAVMRDYLINKGVPEKAIVSDSHGVNTFESAKNTKKILMERNLNSVLVVSSYYHIPRTRLAFEKNGLNLVYSAHGIFKPEIRDFYSIPREVLGFYYYLLRK